MTDPTNPNLDAAYKAMCQAISAQERVTRAPDFTSAYLALNACGSSVSALRSLRDSCRADEREAIGNMLDTAQQAQRRAEFARNLKS